MKQIFTLVLLILISSLPVYSAEEVVLDASVTENESEINQDSRELTLYEKIQNIKSKEHEDTSKPQYLLEEILTKKFENSIVEDAHFFSSLRTDFDMIMNSRDKSLNCNTSLIDAGVMGNFKDGKSYYEARFKFHHQHDYSFLQYMPSNLYIATRAIPHHNIILGSTRTPVGVEGGMTTLTTPFMLRSQISRNFGNIRKFGLRIQGDYSLLDYDIGGYSSDSYYRKFFPGGEFTGWINLKPLGKTDGKYGKLKIGSGISGGHNNFDYFLSGAYVGYEYKNLTADFEWGHASGYNGAVELTNKHAEGFNTTVGYKITPKIQVLARYDQFVPDKKYSDDVRREYSAGLNYFIKGQGLKLMLNYVFCENTVMKNSHRILLGMQMLL